MRPQTLLFLCTMVMQIFLEFFINSPRWLEVLLPLRLPLLLLLLLALPMSLSPIELQNHSFSALACSTCEQIFLIIYSSLVCTLYVLDLYFVFWVALREIMICLGTSPRRQGSTFCPSWNSDKSGLGSKRLNHGRHCSTTPVVVDQWSSMGIIQSWIIRIMILSLTTITEHWSTSSSLWLSVDYEINADSDTFIVNMVNAILPNHSVTWFCPKHHGFFFENQLFAAFNRLTSQFRKNNSHLWYFSHPPITSVTLSLSLKRFQSKNLLVRNAGKTNCKTLKRSSRERL